MRQVFIDESITEQVSLATLIAMEFDSSFMKNFTYDFYKIIKSIHDTFPQDLKSSRRIYESAVLHGNSFLTNSKDNPNLNFNHIDDDFRIEKLNQIISIVNKYKIRTVRFGYSNYNEIRKLSFGDDKLYGLNWFSIAKYFNESEEDDYMFVMDGTNSKMIDIFSRMIKGLKEGYYMHDLKESLMIDKMERFNNNVFYVPLKYSEPMQVVDIVGYLLQKVDFCKISGKTSEYSKKLLKVISNLDEELLTSSIIKLKYGGKIIE